MRVFQINTVYKTGSTGRIAESLQRGLRDRGHDSIVAYGRGNKINNADGFKFTDISDVTIHVAMTRLIDRHGLYSDAATIRLIKEIRKYNPDIIHLHNIHGYYVNYELLFDFLKEYGKPIVWTLHDCWAFTGHCAYFTKSKCEKWVNGCYACTEKRSYPASYFVDNSKENYEIKKRIFTSINKDLIIIVTPSDWLKGLVERSFLKKYKITTIHNGINIKKFKSLETGCKNNKTKKLIAVASPWDERKGLHYLVEMAKKMPKDYELKIVGLSKKQIKDIRPLNNLKLYSKTSNLDELIKLYSDSDYFVNTTIEDNYPTVNLEALACDLPVITFPTGGSVESVREMGGAVTSSFSVEEMIHVIEDFNGKVKDNKDFIDERVMQNSYFDIYNSVLLVGGTNGYCNSVF